MKTVIVKSKKLFVKADMVIEQGMLRIEEGRIAAVGTDLDIPEEADILDCSGSFVYPGFIDACSRLGINKEPFDYMTEVRDGSDEASANDTNECSQYAARETGAGPKRNSGSYGGFR